MKLLIALIILNLTTVSAQALEYTAIGSSGSRNSNERIDARYTAVTSLVGVVSDDLSGLRSEMSLLADTLSRFQVCAAKGMIYSTNTTASDGCIAPQAGAFKKGASCEFTRNWGGSSITDTYTCAQLKSMDGTCKNFSQNNQVASYPNQIGRGNLVRCRDRSGSRQGNTVCEAKFRGYINDTGACVDDNLTLVVQAEEDAENTFAPVEEISSNVETAPEKQTKFYTVKNTKAGTFHPMSWNPEFGSGTKKLTVDRFLPMHSGSLINNNGMITFRPKADFFGDAFFDYTIKDSLGQSMKGTVFLDVIDDGDGTVTEYTIKNTKAGTFKPLALHPELGSGNKRLTLRELEPSRAGTLTHNNDDSITFKPNAGYAGQASFVYTAKNNSGKVVKGTYKLNVIQVTEYTVKNTKAGTFQPVSLHKNLQDPTLTVGTLSPSNAGNLTRYGDAITFKADSTYVGDATFSYTLKGTNGGHVEGLYQLNIVKN